MRQKNKSQVISSNNKKSQTILDLFPDTEKQFRFGRASTNFNLIYLLLPLTKNTEDNHYLVIPVWFIQMRVIKQVISADSFPIIHYLSWNEELILLKLEDVYASAFSWFWFSLKRLTEWFIYILDMFSSFWITWKLSKVDTDVAIQWTKWCRDKLFRCLIDK